MRIALKAATCRYSAALQQALINLLNNAADVFRERLELHARWEQDFLQIEILDRGLGVRPGTRKPLLRPMETDKARGMGLRLFLTHGPAAPGWRGRVAGSRWRRDLYPGAIVLDGSR